MYNHVLAPNTLAEHLLSGPQRTDLLLTAVLNCIPLGNAFLHLLLSCWSKQVSFQPAMPSVGSEPLSAELVAVQAE